MNNKGIAIIFHSGSYDRFYHGISIALSGLAMGWEAKLFFTYWALRYLERGRTISLELDGEGEKYRDILNKNIQQGHIKNINELLSETKLMGASFYACTSSMGLLNITRDELIDIVDKSMGITTFLAEIEGYMTLFV